MGELFVLSRTEPCGNGAGGGLRTHVRGDEVRKKQKRVSRPVRIEAWPASVADRRQPWGCSVVCDGRTVRRIGCCSCRGGRRHRLVGDRASCRRAGTAADYWTYCC